MWCVSEQSDTLRTVSSLVGGVQVFLRTATDLGVRLSGCRYGPQNFTYGEWRIDVTEDFWRRRTKLMPDPDFDRHTMASMRRDNPDVPVEVALATYKPEVTDQWTQKLRDALSTDNDDGKVYSVKDDKAYISENFPDNTFSCEAELVQ